MSEKVCLTEEPSVEGELLQKLDALYCFYHKQWWCHRRMYFHFRRCHGLLNGASLLIMAIGMIVGSVFEKSLIVTALSALGTVIKGWNDFKKYALKVDMSQFAFTTYEKAMIELRSYARGLPLEDLDGFLVKMQTLDETVSDFASPVTDRCSRHYDGTFVYTPAEATPA